MKKPIKKRVQPQQAATPVNKTNNNLLYGLIGAGILAVVFLVLTIMYMQKQKQTLAQVQKAQMELNELKKPKYNEQLDLLTEQCSQNQVACLSVSTRTPHVEILKFLVNFKQYPNTQYRLFMEIQHSGEVVTTPFQYQCNAGGKQFYICQDISATHPVEVLRVFERSYATLSPKATYQFNLMVKPTSEQLSPAPIRLTPNNDLVVLDENGNPVTSVRDTATETKVPSPEQQVPAAQ